MNHKTTCAEIDAEISSLEKCLKNLEIEVAEELREELRVEDERRKAFKEKHPDSIWWPSYRLISTDKERRLQWVRNRIPYLQETYRKQRVIELLYRGARMRETVEI